MANVAFALPDALGDRDDNVNQDENKANEVYSRSIQNLYVHFNVRSFKVFKKREHRVLFENSEVIDNTPPDDNVDAKFTKKRKR